MKLCPKIRKLTCNTIKLVGFVEASGGTIALVNPLKEVFDLLRRVHNGVFTEVEIGRL